MTVFLESPKLGFDLFFSSLLCFRKLNGAKCSNSVSSTHNIHELWCSRKRIWLSPYSIHRWLGIMWQDNGTREGKKEEMNGVMSNLSNKEYREGSVFSSSSSHTNSSVIKMHKITLGRSKKDLEQCWGFPSFSWILEISWEGLCLGSIIVLLIHQTIF